VGPWLPEPVHTADGALGPLDTAELRDSLSLGFLTLLERLSAPERAVFVLREAFALPYVEVAAAVGKSIPACRQLHVRATTKLGGERPAAVRSGRRELLERLLAAVAAADVSGLTALLVDDAVLVSDGGGVVSAARRPVQGADRIARFLIGVATRVPAGTELVVEEVNGAECLVLRAAGAVTQVLSADVCGDRVTGLQIVSNPAKLSRIERLPRRTG
jgi:RNA polymerase sigma-70 factor (ECF subfamily)